MVYFFALFLTGCFSFLTLSCGLDVYYVMESPSTVSQCSYDASWENRYAAFRTPVMPDTAFKFLGTDIYYKIYNTNSDSEVSSLYSDSQNDEKKMNVASRMIETYKYQPLKVRGNNDSPLIPSHDHFQYIKIRLTNYYENLSEQGTAGIYVDYNNVNEVKNIGAPIRGIEENGDYTFDFGRSSQSDYNRIPVKEDNDVKLSPYPTEEGKYYVALFAVAIGLDTTTYIKYYSNVAYLGTFCIDSKSADN